MVKAMAMKAMKSSGYQLDRFDVGQVKAHMHHGLGSTSISQIMVKADGTSKFSEQAILDCMNKLKSNLKWRGDRQPGSGAPRKTTKKQDKQVIQYLLKQRGKQKVTVSKLKRKFVFLKKLSDSLVEDRLHEEDLKWLRRRSKSIVTKAYLQPRLDYCRALKNKHQSTLQKWCYTDGTTFFLDRDDDEHEHSQRRALGTHVWRRSDNKDSTFQECMGPSSYSKGQGVPVRVWGFLAMGVLHIEILEPDEVMNSDLYAELVEDKFEKWAGDCEFLVCDYERCLRSDVALHALSKTGLQLVDPYPKRSQDFNAIENAWKELKQRLDHTMPTHLEGREEFIVRLKSATRWLNEHRSKQLLKLSTNQKERANDCLNQKPPGGRTKW